MTTDVTDNDEYYEPAIAKRPLPKAVSAPAAKEPGVRRYMVRSRDMHEWNYTCPDEKYACSAVVLSSDHDSAVAALAAQVEALTDDRDACYGRADAYRKAWLEITAENAAMRELLTDCEFALRAVTTPETFQKLEALLASKAGEKT